VQSAELQQPDAFLVVAKLNEGYVLQYGGDYTVAVTNPSDLAKRVQEVAERSEVGFQVPMSEQFPPTHLRPNIDYPAPGPTPELMQATAVPSADQVVPTVTLEQEWSNVRKMIAWTFAGFDEQGRAFTRKDWDAALPIFAPHVDPKEADFELSEFLSEMHPEE
jgi:hypothetical protein